MTTMLIRRLALLGQQNFSGDHPLIHARYFSQELGANCPEAIKKFIEQEKIEKPTLIQEKTLSIAMQIKKNFPVVKKRSALWFFSNELNGDAQKCVATNAANGSKMSRNKILQLWNNMDPESKRKYFNMSEFDELRYKQQKSLWLSEVGTLVQKYGSIDRVVELAPDHERLQTEFLASLEKLQNCYELMIQTESTKMIYKEAIKRVSNNEPSLNSEELISAVPKHHRAILTKPRRPPAPFVLFLGDNIDKCRQIKRETRTKQAVVRLAANEWNSLDNETKQLYEDRYNKLKDEYLKAMELYKLECLESDGNYLQLASLEKKAFKRSLRRRLRSSSLLPLSIRNAFNFFMMDNKDSKLSDATELWRNLPAEAKQKYIKMNQDDVMRYQREIAAYNEMRKTLGDAGSRRRSKSDSDIK